MVASVSSNAPVFVPEGPARNVERFMLSKLQFKLLCRAIEWIEQRGYVVNYRGQPPESIMLAWRFRQRAQNDFLPDTLRTVKWEPGVVAVVGVLRWQLLS